MSIDLEEDLERLKSLLLEMGSKATTMIEDSVHALLIRDVSVGAHVRELENDVNKLQLQIDEQCSKMLALRQPVAQDLRFIIGSMKISSDLERIGDQSISILNHTRTLAHFPDCKPMTDIPRMSELAYGMVRDALQAFVGRDSASAREILLRDDEVDSLKNRVIQNLLTFMVEDPKTIRPCLQFVLAARNLERIADHATNIAEDVVYMVESKDVRHHMEKSE